MAIEIDRAKLGGRFDDLSDDDIETLLTAATSIISGIMWIDVDDELLEEPMPEDLQEAIIVIADFTLANISITNSGGMQSETIGTNYSYSRYRDIMQNHYKALAPQLSLLLTKYKIQSLPQVGD